MYKRIKHKIPLSLIALRLALGLVLLLCTIFKINNLAVISVSVLIIGLLSDIFDGIIARKLGVSNERLRRLDSTSDQLFFINVVIAASIQHPTFFIQNKWMIFILFLFEAGCYTASYLKFKREVATHSLGAKAWALIVTATLVQIFLYGHSHMLFSICFWVGIITRTEIIMIFLVLKKWQSDVPSLFYAVKIRQGKQVNYHSLFNG